MLKIDVLDRNILFELDVNCRKSYQQIARKVNVSKEVVAYRIKRLEDNNVIFKYFTVLDPSKLGYSLNKIMFKLENVNINEKEKIIQHLKKHPNSLWTVECDGPFDIGFMVFSRTPLELNEVIAEVCNKYNKCINQRVISTNIIGEYFSRNYLIKKPKVYKNIDYGKEKEISDLDKIDWQILLKLSENARIPITEIAKHIPLGVDAIISRIKKMEKSEIIKSYSILINNEKIQQLHFKTLIYLKDLSKEKIESIKEFCRQNLNITYLIISSGVWDLEIDIEVETQEKYREIMLELMRQFPNTIRKYDTLHIYKLHQYRYLPDQLVLIDI